MLTSRLPRLLSAVSLAVTVLVAQAFSAHAAQAATSPVVASGSTLGATINLSSTFTASSGANYVLDTEVFNGAGQRVAQFAETVWFNGSQTRSYSWNTNGLAAGTYKFQQGLFTANWARNISWNSNAGSVTLGSAMTAASSTSTSSPWTFWAQGKATSGNIPVQSIFKAPSNIGATAVIVDTEVFNKSGSKIAQWFEGTTLSAGQTVDRTYNWNVSSVAAGTYQIRQFVFTSNWSQKLGQGSAYNVNVTSTSTAPAATTTTTTTAAPTPTTTTTTAIPAGSSSWNLSSSATGTTTKSVSSKFVAPNNFASTNVQLDTEVYNASGSKIAQWTEGVNFSANQTITKSYDWNTNGISSGTYTVRQGVFSNDWSRNYAWNGDSSTMTVAALAAVSVPTTTAAPAPSYSDNSGNPLASSNGFYVNSWSQAKVAADSRRSWDPTGAAYLDRIHAGGAAVWLGAWNSDVRGDVNNIVSAATSQGQTPVFVAYNIPNRDCGSYSAGGAGSADGYRSWIQNVANGINGRKAAVILEPDALAQLDCLSSGGQTERLSMLRDAVNTLSNSGAAVYLDAGHANWIDASTMATRLQNAGVANARGFSLNVSNFETTSSSTAFGEQISNKLGGKHYVVDTARNGNGSNGEWCNPRGRALGQTPTTNTGVAHADGYIWIKQPGESDGTCNGGPSAGQFWADYAIGLAKGWS